LAWTFRVGRAGRALRDRVTRKDLAFSSCLQLGGAAGRSGKKLIWERFKAIASREQSGYAYKQWSDVLRAIYLAQRNMTAYVALAGQTGLTPQDCLALGRLLAPRKPNEARRG
jgi:hypothetical protein